MGSFSLLVVVLVLDIASCILIGLEIFQPASTVLTLIWVQVQWGPYLLCFANLGKL